MPEATIWNSYMSRFLLSLVLVIFTATNALASENDSKPDITEFTLDNGLRLVVIPDRRAPVVTHMAWYKVGSADDPQGNSGLAHFFEHLMFKGTSTYKNSEFSSAVSAIGGQENAFTSWDYTAYYQKVAPSALADMMKFEADRMRNLVVSKDVFYPERDVILEERSGRVDRSPSAILSEFSRAALYVNHPYSIPIIGWEHEIANLQLEDAIAFYNRWYQPWNAIIVVAGDVDPQATLKLAEETYGKIVATTEPTIRKWTKSPRAVVAQTLEYKDDRVTQPSWQRSFRAPSYLTAEEGEAEALDLLSTILGGSATSRFQKEIVLDQELATAAGAFYQGSSRDVSTFGFYAVPRGETKLEDVAKALEIQIDKLLKDGVTQEELDRARQVYLKTIIYSQDSQVTLARIFGSILTIGGSVEDFTTWPDRLRKVSVEDVNKVARKYLDRNRSITSRLLPKEG